MKVNEILLEAMSFGQMQQVVYDYVFSKIKSSPKTKEVVSQLRQLARDTDQFWVSDFDDLQQAFKDQNLDDIKNHLAYGIEAMVHEIEEYVTNRMNHEPGYKPPQLFIGANMTADGIPDKDLDSIITKVDPQIVARVKKELEQAAKNRAAAKAKQVKSITKERIEEVAAFVKKHSKAGWNKFYLATQKDKFILSNVVDDYGVTEEDIKKGGGEGLKKAVRAKNETTPQYNVYSEYENIMELDLPDSIENESLLQSLRIIAGNKGLANKLWSLIK